MVVKVVVLALSKSGENTARSIAEKFDIMSDPAKNEEVLASE